MSDYECVCENHLQICIWTLIKVLY